MFRTQSRLHENLRPPQVCRTCLPESVSIPQSQCRRPTASRQVVKRRQRRPRLQVRERISGQSCAAFCSTSNGCRMTLLLRGSATTTATATATSTATTTATNSVITATVLLHAIRPQAAQTRGEPKLASTKRPFQTRFDRKLYSVACILPNRCNCNIPATGT